MVPYTRIEKINEPIGPLDKQVQKSSLSNELDDLLRAAIAQAAQDYPDATYNGYTFEIVPDGAGTPHYNLTAHFKVHEPHLPPRNLNAAPEGIFGNTLNDAEKAQKGVGLWDQKWKGF